ncbi:MAG: HesA/MoeB/ThiF family protein [Peptococcaceae bacterium]|nr:HesA/MoeB/ThiF family protein [Peptococcaceae bacterium]
MLNSQQLARYNRNILLAGFGPEGQEKLLNSGVLLVGAGGLGSPAAFYLAAAGVGRIGLMDGDRVEVSNLQRQILHGTPDLGRPKAESGRDKLLHLNPGLKVTAVGERLTEENAPELIAEYDLVLDCTDNFQARFILNDACLRLNKPFVYGGVLAYIGQLMFIMPGRGPCFRCLYRSEPRGNLPDCSTVGVLGAVPGVIGTLQACEAVKYLAGLGDLLVGRLLTYDALTASFMDVRLERDPSCPSCGGGLNGA